MGSGGLLALFEHYQRNDTDGKKKEELLKNSTSGLRLMKRQGHCVVRQTAGMAGAVKPVGRIVSCHILLIRQCSGLFLERPELAA